MDTRIAPHYRRLTLEILGQMTELTTNPTEELLFNHIHSRARAVGDANMLLKPEPCHSPSQISTFSFQDIQERAKNAIPIPRPQEIPQNVELSIQNNLLLDLMASMRPRRLQGRLRMSYLKITQVTQHKTVSCHHSKTPICLKASISTFLHYLKEQPPRGDQEAASTVIIPAPSRQCHKRYSQNVLVRAAC